MRQVQTPASGDATLATATAKVKRHLLPMMVFIYFLSFIDRTNVALAKSAFQADLGITAAMYGFGAGIFFWGYALLEVPSNLLAHRIGPRRISSNSAIAGSASCRRFSATTTGPARASRVSAVRYPTPVSRCHRNGTSKCPTLWTMPARRRAI